MAYMLQGIEYKIVFDVLINTKINLKSTQEPILIHNEKYSKITINSTNTPSIDMSKDDTVKMMVEMMKKPPYTSYIIKIIPYRIVVSPTDLDIAKTILSKMRIEKVKPLEDFFGSNIDQEIINL